MRNRIKVSAQKILSTSKNVIVRFTKESKKR